MYVKHFIFSKKANIQLRPRRILCLHKSLRRVWFFKSPLSLIFFSSCYYEKFCLKLLKNYCIIKKNPWHVLQIFLMLLYWKNNLLTWLFGPCVQRVHRNLGVLSQNKIFAIFFSNSFINFTFISAKFLNWRWFWKIFRKKWFFASIKFNKKDMAFFLKVRFNKD